MSAMEYAAQKKMATKRWEENHAVGEALDRKGRPDELPDHSAVAVRDDLPTNGHSASVRGLAS